MSETQWYELRVVGSAGTLAGGANAIGQGIALSESGRLCPVSSGKAKKFDLEKDAIEFLSKTTVPALYPFEAVLCRPTSLADTGRRQPPLDRAA